MKVIVGILLVIMLLVLALLAYRKTANKMPDLPFQEEKKSEGKKDKKDKKNKKKDIDQESYSSANIKVLQRWYMPDVLTEVSDIAHVDANLMACIQDELGSIFIYNLETSTIVKRIPFAGAGDYEGIAVAGKIAYVINSSGVLYEVNDINSDKPAIKQYKTGFTEKDDVEAICYDIRNNRLLVAFKREETNDSKAIYSFDLETKRMEANPVYTIEAGVVGREKKGKKKNDNIKPSAIAIHPVTAEIYITEGTNPQLMILDKQGQIKSLFNLEGSDFAQPEGITFNAAGEMFISNEGRKEAGNILKVSL